MKQRKKWTTQFKHLVIGICALFVVFAFGSTALAGFIYDATTYEEEETSETLAADSGYVTIDFRYAFYSDIEATDLDNENATKSDLTNYYEGTEYPIGYANGDTITVSTKAQYYALNSFLVAHTNLSAELTGSTEGITYTAVDTQISQGDAVKGYTGIMYTIIVYTTIHADEDFAYVGLANSYTGNYVMYSQEYTTQYTTRQSSATVRKSLSVPSGYSLTDTYVSNLFSNGVDGYAFYGLVDAVEQDGTYVPSETLSLTYSYGDAITGEKHFYAIFTKSSTTTSSITTAVNNTTDGNTSNIYIGAGGENCNISTDPTYVSSINNVALGSSDVVVTVAEGATVNLCLNSSATQAYATYSTTPYDATTNPTGYYLKVEPQEENRAYTVSLQNDLYVDGTLVIGGTYGSGITQATQGNINSYYVVLDLNGHNIYVSSTGSINCYGMIIDSSQVAGTIYLYGGNITTLVVMLDYKDFTNTFACAMSYVCPFQLYFIPYLRCRVEFTYDSTNGWGQINSFCRVHASSVDLLDTLPITGAATDLYLNLIGPAADPDASDATHFIFELETPDTTDASVVYEYNTLDGVLTDADASAQDLQDINDYSLYVRNGLTFNNVTFTMGTLDISFNILGLIDLTVGYANDFNFPISPFFDITLNGSTFSLDSMVQFEAGSSLTLDSESTILFTTSTYSGGAYAGTSVLRFGSLSALDKGINYYDKELNTFVEDNAMNGASLDAKAATDDFAADYTIETTYDISAPLTTFVDDYFWGNETLWKYLGSASVNIMGNIMFDCPSSSSEATNVINSGAAYKIAGEINFIEDNVGLISGDMTLTYGGLVAGTYDELLSDYSSVLPYLKSLDPFTAITYGMYAATSGNYPLCIQTCGYDFIPNQYVGAFYGYEDLGYYYKLSTYMSLLSYTIQMMYGASNARGYARPLVSYGEAYVVDSIADSTYYGCPTVSYKGTYDFDDGIFTSEKYNTVLTLGTTETTTDNLYYFDTYNSDINSADESSTDYYDLASTFNSYGTLLLGVSLGMSTVDSKYNAQTPTTTYTTTDSYVYDLPNYELTLTPITGQYTDDIGPYITSGASGISGAKYRYFAGIWVMDSNYYSSFQMILMNYLPYLMAYMYDGDLSGVSTYQTMVNNMLNSLQSNLLTNLNVPISGNGTYTVSYVGKIFSWGGCSMAALYYDSSCQCYKYDATYSSAVLNLEVNFDNLMDMMGY